MARRIITWDDWSAGEFGRIEPWKAPHNSFTGNNMMVYRTGELGVRPGLLARNPSGLANGLVHGFGMARFADNDAWFIQGTAVRTFSLTDADNLKTSGTALSATPSRPVDYDLDGETVLFVLYNDKVYRLSPQSGATLPTVTRFGDSNAGMCIAVYGDRLLLGDSSGSSFNEYEITFSDGGDFTNFPADNFFAVGDAFGVRSLHVQRQHLAIGKPFSWHVMTGVPGFNNVLRQIAEINGPPTPQHATTRFPDEVWVHALGTTYPTLFRGTPPTQLQNLDELVTADVHSNPFPPDVAMSVTRGRDNGVAIAGRSDGSMLLYMNGVWTKHTLGVTVAYGAHRMPTDQIMAFCDGGDAAADPNFYAVDFTLDHPGGVAGTSSPGDDSTTALTGTATFPEWHAQDGDEVYVRSVIVDFRTWDTQASNNNHYDLTVNLLRRYGDTSPVASNTVSFDEAPGSSTSSGVIERRVYGFGEQGPGNGFQLLFANVRGIAIQRVQVIVDTMPFRI